MSISPYKLSLGQDVAFHRLFHSPLGRGRFEVEPLIEGVERKEVAMRLAGWRAGSAVPGLPKIVDALASPARQIVCWRHTFGKLSRARRQVIHDPVDPGSTGSVRVVHDQGEALGAGGRPPPVERRRGISSLAGALPRNIARALQSARLP